MSPLLFLVIPLVVFIVGSGLLYLGSRWRGSTARYRNAPTDLRTMAPLLKDQREAGWPVDSGHNNRR